MKVLEEREDHLLSRKIFIAEIEYAKKATPSKEDVRKKIAESLNVKEELVALKNIYPIFGVEKAKVIAHIYKDVKDLKDIEEIKKKKGKVKKAPTEKPAKQETSAKKAEEKPAEETPKEE